MYVLEIIAAVSLALSFLCALVMVLDLTARPQRMGVMNLVWPITALYGSVLAFWLYWAHGRAPRQGTPVHAHHDSKHADGPPSWVETTLATTHCGAGCALADIVVESAIAHFRLTVFGSSLGASYLYDFLGAWTLGVLFQYFSIRPMSDLSPRQALLAAIRADTLSIVAFQVGMYLWMALARFALFPGGQLPAHPLLRWADMQVAMLLGFATAWPMNRWLIARGWKHRM